MLIFHEGLPRSGKSYEAMVEHIIPALSKGRHVFTNMEGINFPQVAELAGIPEANCSLLLQIITEEQIPTIYDHVTDNSLVVIDELQDYFPQKQKPLEKKITEFVAKHGHRGLDLVCMGQSHKDCHALFKRRIDRLIVFIKKDMLGKPDEYHWQLFKQVPGGRFVQVSKGSKKYAPKYFGCYKSFDEGAIDDEAQSDKRGSIFNSWGFKFGLPIAGGMICCAVAYLAYMFFGGGFQSMTGVDDAKKTKQSKTVAAVPVVSGPVVGVPDSSGGGVSARSVAKVDYQESELDKHNEKWRPRLAGVISAKGRLQVIIEWYDDSLRVKERLDLAGLAGYGYTAVVDDGGATVGGKGRKPFRVTTWPMEAYSGATSRPMLQAISPPAGAAEDRHPVVLRVPESSAPVPLPEKSKPFSHIRE